MSKRRERERLSERGRSRVLRTWGLYLLALTAWVTVVLLLAFLGYLVCSAITWYDPLNPVYQFLNWVRDYFFFVCVLVVLAGWVAIGVMTANVIFAPVFSRLFLTGEQE